MRALIALQLLCCASAFYVPLLAPQSYKADEEVRLHPLQHILSKNAERCSS
jgi:hypothetical protein